MRRKRAWSRCLKQREFGGHVLPCLGQEAIPAAFSKVLAPTDYVVTGHRGGGHYIARGGDLNGLWAELYGKATGVMKGRGGQMHLVDMAANTIAGNAIVGAQWVLGTGAGLAAKLEGGDQSRRSSAAKAPRTGARSTKG